MQTICVVSKSDGGDIVHFHIEEDKLTEWYAENKHRPIVCISRGECFTVSVWEVRPTKLQAAGG